ncbi:MAG: adenylate kinase [Actinobacteria bacterium]|nr:adenylate kinase [Actinomycetota bacterium]
MSAHRGPRLVLLGKQGAGKGTQAERLAAHFRMQHLSTGQLFRDSAAAGVPAGLEAKEYMDRGELVPDKIVVAVVAERFANPAEVDPGFVLDGFPRTENQAIELDGILGERGLDVVVDIDVPREVVLDRLAARNREDDTEDGIRRRLELYESETKPLVDFYRERRLLVTIDGVGEEDDVHRRVLAAIDARFDPLRADSA